MSSNEASPRPLARPAFTPAATAGHWGGGRTNVGWARGRGTCRGLWSTAARRPQQAQRLLRPGGHRPTRIVRAVVSWHGHLALVPVPTGWKPVLRVP